MRKKVNKRGMKNLGKQQHYEDTVISNENNTMRKTMRR